MNNKMNDSAAQHMSSRSQPLVQPSVQPPVLSSCCKEFDVETAAFYRRVLEILQAASAPFVVGGTYAQSCYTGSQRPTKDLDLFIRKSDYPYISNIMREAGYETDLTYSHWLAKIRLDEAFIDVIFSSGNGISTVDDEWFEYASDAEVLGVPVRIAPVEEMIWSKAFIMERERYDGADVAHLLHVRSRQLDWERLLRRFDTHWRVLLSHLVLFGFIYPDEQTLIPQWVMNYLNDRLTLETHGEQPPARLCQGTLLSREQYLHDIEQQGYRDGRMRPFGNMSTREIAHWTEAIPQRHATDPDTPLQESPHEGGRQACRG
ncbi:nucleotidyltransferase [Uliginosibacterium sp. H3]|uniref:Nucleotidyltransferase n=1 Tax=Uliginosibacterium silvisoli TaxID=3114758 RepID=A0ABU6JXT3_9RHOO|nr:nucleotidyltransferase [Uliginosibacterium sp. H3]